MKYDYAYRNGAGRAGGTDHGDDGQGDLDTDDHHLRIGTDTTDRGAPTWDREL